MRYEFETNRTKQQNADSKSKDHSFGRTGTDRKNITAIECNDSIIVVDCGLAFPSDDMLGIDLCIPDVTYLKQNIDKVKGFVITHGHEDHIGALPYILQQINVPGLWNQADHRSDREQIKRA